MSDQDILQDLVPEDGSDEATPTETPEPKSQARLRPELQDAGFTLEDAAKVREQNQLTDEEFASGEWIPHKELLEVVKATEGVSITQMKKAFGGNRNMFPPLDDRWQVKWRGRSRYHRVWCKSEEAMAFLRTLAPKRRSRQNSVLAQLQDLKKAELATFAEEHELGLTFDSKTTRDQMIEMIAAEMDE